MTSPAFLRPRIAVVLSSGHTNHVRHRDLWTLSSWLVQPAATGSGTLSPSFT